MNRREEREKWRRTRRLRTVGRDVSGSWTSGRPLSVFKPINLYLPGHLFPRVCWKDCSRPSKSCRIGMQRRAAMRFVGGLPFPSESAVSCFPRSCAGPRHHRQNRLHGYQGRTVCAQLPAPAADRLTNPRGVPPSNRKGIQCGKDPRKKLGPRELSRKSSDSEEDWVECESTNSLP